MKAKGEVCDRLEDFKPQKDLLVSLECPNELFTPTAFVAVWEAL